MRTFAGQLLAVIVFFHCAAIESSCKLRLEPLYPKAIIGRPLTLWCSSDSYITSHLKFVFYLKINNETRTMISNRTDINCSLTSINWTCLVSSAYLRVVNSSMIEMTYPNVHQAFDQAYVECQDPGLNHSSCRRELDIGHFPFVPNISSLIVNNWQNFEFNWTTTNSNQNFWTNFTAAYRRVNESGYTVCVECCTDPQTGLCGKACRKCLIEDILHLTYPSHLLYIIVDASNRFGHVSTGDIEVNLKSVNRPNVTELHTTFNTTAIHNGLHNGTLIVQLKPPRYGIELMYRTYIQCDELNQTLTSERNTVDGVLTMYYSVMLPPFARCRTHVSCASVETNGQPVGLWSLPQVDQFETPEMVPSTAVRTCSSCFSIQVQNSSSRVVTIFYKNLTEREARGFITAYRVRYVVDGVEHDILRDRGERSATFNLDHSFACTVTVNARTAAGFNETLPFIMLAIPKQDQVSAGAVNVSVIVINVTRNVVRMTWNESKEVAFYTVVWCEKHEGATESCKDELHWTVIDGLATHYDIDMSLKDVGRYRYGVATQNIYGLYSGIEWIGCTYYITKPPHIPGLTVGSRSFSSVTLVVHKPACDREQGFIYAFVIKYWRSNTTQGVNRRKIQVRDVEIVSDVYTVHGLSPDTEYSFVVEAVSWGGKSAASSIAVTRTELEPQFTPAIILSMVVGLTVALALVLVGLIGFIRVNYGCYLKFRNWIKIGIKPPERHQLEHELDEYNRVSFPFPIAAVAADGVVEDGTARYSYIPEHQWTKRASDSVEHETLLNTSAQSNSAQGSSRGSTHYRYSDNTVHDGSSASMNNSLLSYEKCANIGSLVDDGRLAHGYSSYDDDDDDHETSQFIAAVDRSANGDDDVSSYCQCTNKDDDEFSCGDFESEPGRLSVSQSDIAGYSLLVNDDNQLASDADNRAIDGDVSPHGFNCSLDGVALPAVWSETVPDYSDNTSDMPSYSRCMNALVVDDADNDCLAFMHSAVSVNQILSDVEDTDSVHSDSSTASCDTATCHLQSDDVTRPPDLRRNSEDDNESVFDYSVCIAADDHLPDESSPSTPRASVDADVETDADNDQLTAATPRDDVAASLVIIGESEFGCSICDSADSLHSGDGSRCLDADSGVSNSFASSQTDLTGTAVAVGTSHSCAADDSDGYAKCARRTSSSSDGAPFYGDMDSGVHEFGVLDDDNLNQTMAPSSDVSLSGSVGEIDFGYSLSTTAGRQSNGSLSDEHD